jgi:hypothetical protein
VGSHLLTSAEIGTRDFKSAASHNQTGPLPSSNADGLVRIWEADARGRASYSRTAVSEAACFVAIDHPDSLHKRIAGSRAQKFKAAFLQLFRHLRCHWPEVRDSRPSFLLR